MVKRMNRIFTQDELIGKTIAGFVEFGIHPQRLAIAFTDGTFAVIDCNYPNYSEWPGYRIEISQDGFDDRELKELNAKLESIRSRGFVNASVDSITSLHPIERHVKELRPIVLGDSELTRGNVEWFQ